MWGWRCKISSLTAKRFWESNNRDQKAKQKNLCMATMYHESVPPLVTTDNRRLQQILYNLLGNAVKFSKPNGTVELRVQVLDNSRLTHNSNTNGKNLLEKNQNNNIPEGGDKGNSEQEQNSKSNESSTVVSGSCPFHNDSHQNDTAMTDASLESNKCPFTSIDSEQDKEMVEHGSKNSERHHGKHNNKKTMNHAPHNISNNVNNASLKTSQRILRFSVKDYGLGIKQQDFQKIFQPFQQADSDTETFYGGTGLGLAITTKLIKGLGGAIEVDSVLGAWTEFTVDLPLDEEDTFDMEDLCQTVRTSTTVLSVHAKINDNNSGNNNDTARMFTQQKIPFRGFHNMQDMLTEVEQPNGIETERVHIVVADETLFDTSAYAEFTNMVKAGTVLVTYGPNYSIKETNLHFRSMQQVLPSVFMGSLVSQMESSLQRKNGVKPETAEAAIKPISYDQLRVLIAEDNVINQKVLTRMLSRLGVKKVDLAPNGEIAVSKSADKEYDIIFMDMQMPVMDGCEATQHIIERRGSSVLPKVIFVTANAAEAFEAKANDAGADGFITKPFSLDMIEKAFSIL